jgi:predicted RecB family nuclease
MRPLAEKLIEVLGDTGPVFMVSSYEKTTINGLIKLFPDLKPQLQAIVNRLFDLQKVVKDHYYHPKMLGSYSLKDIAPVMSSRINYEALGEIQEGGAAAKGYLEAINPATTPERKAELEEKLLTYCRVDTEAMVEIVKYFKDIQSDEA